MANLNMNEQDNKMKKEKTLYESLLNIYMRMCYAKEENVVWKGVKINLEEWSGLPAIQEKIFRYSEFIDEIKEILSIFFRADVELEIKRAQEKFDNYDGKTATMKFQLTNELNWLKYILDDTDTNK